MKHYLKISTAFAVISVILTFAIDYGYTYFNLYFLVPFIVLLCCTIAFLFVYFDEKLRK